MDLDDLSEAELARRARGLQEEMERRRRQDDPKRRAHVEDLVVRQRRLVRAVGLETFCAAFDVKHEYQDCSDTLPNKHEPKRSGEPARCLRCYLVERVLRLQSDEVDHVWSSEETVLSLNKEGMERYGV